MEFGVRSVDGPRQCRRDGILEQLRQLHPAGAAWRQSPRGLLEFQYQNVSKVKIRGVELQGEARLADGLRLRASYARHPWRRRLGRRRTCR